MGFVIRFSIRKLLEIACCIFQNFSFSLCGDDCDIFKLRRKKEKRKRKVETENTRFLPEDGHLHCCQLFFATAVDCYPWDESRGNIDTA